MVAGGENPVFRLGVGAGFPPERERLRQDGMDWHRFLRRLGLASTHDTVGDRSDYVHSAVSEINVLPFECEQFALSQARRRCQENQRSLSKGETI
jgi:hypothetical protein